jgi:hypothetical protein
VRSTKLSHAPTPLKLTHGDDNTTGFGPASRAIAVEDRK